jgi:hypothetical protein
VEPIIDPEQRASAVASARARRASRERLAEWSTSALTPTATVAKVPIDTTLSASSMLHW